MNAEFQPVLFSNVRSDRKTCYFRDLPKGSVDR
jgi:hypothetical protein